MKAINKTATLIVTASLISVAQIATAENVIGNISGAPLSSTLLGPNSTTVFKAAGFQMGSTPYNLTSVQLDLTFAATGDIVVQIWDGTTAPANMLTTLASAQTQTGSGIFDFTPTSPFTLQANTAYWVHVTAGPNSGDVNWISTADAPTGIATSLGYNFNGNSSTFMNKYQVNGDAVPEPATMTVLGLGALALLRRKKKA